MNKRLILIGLAVFLLIVIVFALVLSASRGEEEIAPGEAVPASAKPTAVAIDNEWNEITFPADGVSIRVPQRWDTYMYDTLNAGIFSIYRRSWATLDFHLQYLRDNNVDVLEEHLTDTGYSLTEEPIGSRETIKYIGLVPAEEFIFGAETKLNAEEMHKIQELINNSYAVGRLIPFENGVLVVHCQVYGSQHLSFMSECDEVVESLVIQ